jgi:uncharacterized protein
MSGTKLVNIPILTLNQQKVGILTLSCLPNPRYRRNFPLWDLENDPLSDSPLEKIQILEGEEYRYQIHLELPGLVSTDKPEILVADEEEGRTGRLRPRLYVGTLPINLYLDDNLLGYLRLEVRSRKLNYLADYRWMLRDIAAQMAEVVAERFAPTEQRFQPDTSRDAITLYQRFAFLQALITGEEFQSAIAQVLTRPHRLWLDEEGTRSLNKGLQSSSAILKAIVSSKRRQAWTNSQVPNLSSLPLEVPARHREESVDTSENRFIKFVLTNWRGLIGEIQERLLVAQRNYPIERGIRETEHVLTILDSLLAQELFREVGDLTIMPASSPVLAQCEGYREIFHAYLQSEVAAQLSWEGGEDVYGAGQRDVATLYEFWAFLQLAEIVKLFCNEQSLDLSDLLTVSPDGLGLRLSQGKQQILRGSTRRYGRQIGIELYFNRNFTSRSNSPTSGSWTRPMRPDCSIRMSLEPKIGLLEDSVWLHFDAKYKVENITELFGQQPSSEDEEDEQIVEDVNANREGTYKRGDLLKMHAYRDAVRRSAGAYILYPGTEKEIISRYREILPGIGAFPLRPDETGLAEGASTIIDFLNDVLNHLALQSSQDERGRYWNRMVFETDFLPVTVLPASSCFSKPPADTTVLLFPLDTLEQYEWIRQFRIVPLPRQDSSGGIGLLSKSLAVDFVAFLGEFELPFHLWNIQGEAEVYLALSLGEPILDNELSLSSSDRLTQNFEGVSSPTTVSFLDLLRID